MRTLLTRNVGLQPDARGKHFPPEVVYMTEEPAPRAGNLLANGLMLLAALALLWSFANA